MENPQCLMLSMIKVEEGQEVKQEPVDENTELEVIEVDESLPVEETNNEPAMADVDESLDTVLTFSEEDLPRTDHSVDIVQRRRLRFSEDDDIMLLRQVAARNPYRCTALWKEITRVVGERSGKNFSVRSVRDHTDLLMNTFSLRGAEVCLKRTPPQQWGKKKHLLQLVFSIWKKELLPSGTSVVDATKSIKGGKEPSADHQLPSQKVSKNLETPKSSASLLPSTTTVRPASSSSSPLSLVSSSATVLQPQNKNIPVTLHFGTPVRSTACPPLLQNVVLPSAPSLVISSQTGLQNLTVASGLQSSLLRRIAPVQQRLFPVQSPTAPDLIADTIATDPLCLSTSRTWSASSDPLSEPSMVDCSTSPIPLLVNNLTESQTANEALQTPPLSAPVDYSTSASSLQLRRSETDSIQRACRRPAGTMTRGKLEFLKRRHQDQLMLRRRELDLEKRRLVLEEQKLSLEERKVQLDEEKWLFDKREREEKLLMMSEEKEHKMAMERRQQNMIDILLELKKKE